MATAMLGTGSVYLTDWADFIGQDLAKRQLQVAARSAKGRKVPLPHTLLASGAPGVGKTTLGYLCAQEMGTDIHDASGKIKLAEARMMLSQMSDGDVWVIDEIHQLFVGGRQNGEWLLHYLQDGLILGPVGPEEVPKVTVVGCTTDPGRLPETVLGRFYLRPTLVPYTDEEQRAIAAGMAYRLFSEVDLPEPSNKNIDTIATAANGNPRDMRVLLSNLRDLALAEPHEGDDYDIGEVLRWTGTTPDGLTRTAQRYLILLLTKFAGGAGEATLRDALQEPGGLGYIERVLMDKDLIVKTKQGRVLTQHGMRRARELRDAA